MSGASHGVLPTHPPCPRCGRVLRGYVKAGGAPGDDPDPGDVTICAHCGLPLAFTAELGLREVSGDELADLRRDFPDFRRAMDWMARNLVAMKKPDGE